MALRQAVGAHLEARPAIVGARDDHLRIDRDAYSVGLRGDEPGALGIARVGGDGEAEGAGPGLGDRSPQVPTVGGTVDAAMMLHPQHVRIGGALGNRVRVLDIGILGTLGRHEVGPHAGAGVGPGSAGVAGLPDTAARDGDGDMGTVARVDEHAVDASLVVATAHPFAPTFVLP